MIGLPFVLWVPESAETVELIAILLLVVVLGGLLVDSEKSYHAGNKKSNWLIKCNSNTSIYIFNHSNGDVI